MVLGGDGRWHWLEECDDGAAAAGDGCSAQCTVDEIDWLPEQRSYKTGEFNGVAVINFRTVI